MCKRKVETVQSDTDRYNPMSKKHYCGIFFINFLQQIKNTFRFPLQFICLSAVTCIKYTLFLGVILSSEGISQLNSHDENKNRIYCFKGLHQSYRYLFANPVVSVIINCFSYHQNSQCYCLLYQSIVSSNAVLFKDVEVLEIEAFHKFVNYYQYKVTLCSEVYINLWTHLPRLARTQKIYFSNNKNNLPEYVLLNQNQYKLCMHMLLICYMPCTYCETVYRIHVVGAFCQL